jgi:hypothetical protein
MQFSSIGCGKSVILPCLQNAWHFGYEILSRIPIPIKNLMHFLIGIGITIFSTQIINPERFYCQLLGRRPQRRAP